MLLFFFAVFIFWFSHTLWLTWALWRHRDTVPGSDLPSVSVVVAARNERSNLQRLLPGLLAQEYQELEVVVVNDRSSDGSYKWLNEYAHQNKKLRILHLENLPAGYDGKKHALTKGIQAARHEIILLTDADCLPQSPQWVRRMSAPFQSRQTQIVLGFSPYRSSSSPLNYLIRFETLLVGWHYLTSACAGWPYMGVGRNMAYRKSFFVDRQGLNPWITQTGGDDDLFVGAWANRRNTEVVLHPQAHTLSLPKTDWREWLRQKHRHLNAGVRYRFRHRLWTGVWQGSYLLSLLLLPLGWLWWAESPCCYLLFVLFRYAYWGVLIWITQKRLNHFLPLHIVCTFEYIYLLYYMITAGQILRGKRPLWTQNEKNNFPKKP